MKRVLTICVLGLSAASCTHVEPWERETLARRDMALEPHGPIAAARDHAFESREAASGAARADGGGCGCD